jgi:sulfatase maturation enzyme AslB (radical SAM superfamily)
MADAKEFVHNPWFGEMNLLYVDADGSVVPCPVHPMRMCWAICAPSATSDIVLGEQRRQMQEAMAKSRATMSVCGVCEVGPAGNEGPSYWSAFAYWNPEKLQLPQT